jgi:hypothetical protein
MPQTGSCGQEGAIEVDAQKLTPLVQGKIDYRGDVLDAGVANEHINATEGIDGLRDPRIDLLLLSDIHRDREGNAPRFLYLRGRRLGGVEAHIGDDDLSALAGKGLGDVFPDAACGTRYQRHSAFHTHRFTSE